MADLDKRYSKTGEWVAFDGRWWRTGLSASAAADLGDVTFVEPPLVGRRVDVGTPLCALEAVKAAADFYSPVTGTVVATNPRLAAEPELVGTSPETEGWIAALENVDEASLAALMDEADWKAWEAGR